MSVNKKILDYIRKKGVSQIDIANKMGISQSSLNRTLNSKDIKISQLIDISKALGVAPASFFNGKETIDNSELQAIQEELSEAKKIIINYERILNKVAHELEMTGEKEQRTAEQALKSINKFVLTWAVSSLGEIINDKLNKKK